MASTKADKMASLVTEAVSLDTERCTDYIAFFAML